MSSTAEFDPATEVLLEDTRARRTARLGGRALWASVLGKVGHLVRSCHERYDGGGYPDGLAGSDIPIEARIVCCCDAFSAMTTTRSYRRAMSVEAAQEELVRNAGTQFDPGVVAALLEVLLREEFAGAKGEYSRASASGAPPASFAKPAAP